MSDGSHPRPPRLLVLVLGWLLPRVRRADILDDMGELYAHRQARTGMVRATAWYVRRLLGYPPRLLSEYIAGRSTPAGRDSPAPSPRVSDLMDNLIQDLRFAARTLRRSPLFVLVATATLALGVGVNSTLFTLVNTILLRPLPVAAPHELIEIYSVDPDAHVPITTSYPDYEELRRDTTTLSGLAAHQMMVANLTEGGRSAVVYGELVSGNYFEVLGVRPHTGRLIGDDDNLNPGAHPVVVLGHAYWQQRFGADPDIVGRSLSLNGTAFAVIGVAPPAFNGMMHVFTANLWVPTMMATEIDPIGITSVNPSPTGTNRIDRRGTRWLVLKGRLAEGATVQRAGAEIAATMRRLEQEFPDTNDGWSSHVLPATSVRVHPAVDSAMLPVAGVMLGMVGLVLLIACTNIANMMLSRASARRQEIAVRLALGASRSRLVVHLLTESTLLALLGGAAGLLLTYWFTRLLLMVQLPIGIQLSLNLPLDYRVLGFTFSIAFASGLVFGLAPALSASRPDIVDALKEGSRGTGSDRRGFGLRNLLVVAQVAVCVVLLVGAALMARSIGSARAIDVGFVTEGLAAFDIDLDLHDYEDTETVAFFEALVPRLRAVPGVTAIALTSRLPFSISLNTNGVYIEGHQQTPDDPSYQIDAASVDAAYFDTLGVAMLRGRGFEPSDNPDSHRVAIVTDAMARRYWPDDDAIGARFHIDGFDGTAVEIVGVVADYKVRTVGEAPRPYIHYARSQSSSLSFATIAVRTAGDESEVRRLLRQEMRALEPELVFVNDTTMEGLLRVALFPVRAGASLLAVFGALALVLAAVGLYGVIAYSVTRRTQEIGIRVALGARPGDVLRLVVRQGMRLALVGVAVGTLAAAALSGTLSSVLYGISAIDPLAFGTAIGLLLAVASLANYLPARRAARVDPMAALRD